MKDHGLWILRQSVEGHTHTSNYFGYDQSNRIINDREIRDALMELRYERGSLTIPGHPVIPAGFPHVVFSLPPMDFEPDFFEHRGMMFVSKRFRDALAQPPEVVQYWPVDLVRSSDEAREQDYRLFRVLAAQPALDRERSVYDSEKITNRRTGETFPFIGSIDRFVPIDGLVPRSEIFCAAEDVFVILAIDALAERVLRAGCDGVAFEEPETIGMTNIEPQRRRTADGIHIHDPRLPAT